jgi:hypothetical protein
VRSNGKGIIDYGMYHRTIQTKLPKHRAQNISLEVKTKDGEAEVKLEGHKDIEAGSSNTEENVSMVAVSAEFGRCYSHVSDEDSDAINADAKADEQSLEAQVNLRKESNHETEAKLEGEAEACMDDELHEGRE